MIIGPGQAKKGPTQVQHSNDDILGLDLLGAGSSINKPSQTILTFDQLLGSSNSTQNKQISAYNDLIWVCFWKFLASIKILLLNFYIFILLKKKELK